MSYCSFSPLASKVPGLSLPQASLTPAEGIHCFGK